MGSQWREGPRFERSAHLIQTAIKIASQNGVTQRVEEADVADVCAHLSGRRPTIAVLLILIDRTDRGWIKLEPKEALWREL